MYSHRKRGSEKNEFIYSLIDLNERILTNVYNMESKISFKHVLLNSTDKVSQFNFYYIKDQDQIYKENAQIWF